MTDDDPALLGLPETAEDASEGLPRYLQVASTLRTAILRGIYPVGSRMPTEEALCQRFKVSRHTIREALRQLRAGGLIDSRPGSRPIVASAAPRRSEVIAGDIGRDFFDYTIGTKLEIEGMETIPISSALADETGLPEGEDCLYVRGYRVSVDDGQATCWNAYFIRAEYALVGRLLRRHVGPLIPLLEDLFEERIATITRSISAVAMPPAQISRFRLEPGAAALQIDVRCETGGGKVAMVNRSLHPRGVISYTIRR
jgi:DNA-binding GntR family transcriptional regulator